MKWYGPLKTEMTPEGSTFMKGKFKRKLPIYHTTIKCNLGGYMVQYKKVTRQTFEGNYVKYNSKIRTYTMSFIIAYIMCLWINFWPQNNLKIKDYSQLNLVIRKSQLPNY